MKDLVSTTMVWFSQNYGWFLSLLIQGFIAYHVYWLTQRLTSKAKLEHKEEIKKRAEELLSKIRNQRLNHKVYLVNIDRYFRDYPSNKEKRFEGYSHIAAEIKAVRFDGIEFFAEMPVEVYKTTKGTLTFKGKGKSVFNAYPVGIVPYEWIDYVDLDGDEYDFVPLFYCRFKGMTSWRFWRRFLFFGYPYRRMVYYKSRKNSGQSSDPPDMKYEYINQRIN